MEPAQSISPSVDALTVALSTSCPVHNDMQVPDSQLGPSLALDNVVCFQRRCVRTHQEVPAETKIKAIEQSGSEQQNRCGLAHADISIFNYAQASEKQLLVAVEASDERAFAELSGRSTNTIRKRVFRIVRNREDTEDVMQETLLKAYTHFREFRGTCRFSTWLTRIAINSALMVLRKRKRRSEVPLNREGKEEQTWEVWDFPDQSPNPEQACAQSQVLDFVSRAINRLPPAYRDAIVLHHLHESSLQECSDAVGISVGAAKSRLLRARLIVRSTLEKRHLFARDCPLLSSSKTAS
jgi:RNA polymerase sigma-70 factor, ECF subfamily